MEHGDSLHTSIFPESVVPVKTKAEALNGDWVKLVMLQEVFPKEWYLHELQQPDAITLLKRVFYSPFFFIGSGYFSAVAVEVFSV